MTGKRTYHGLLLLETRKKEVLQISPKVFVNLLFRLRDGVFQCSDDSGFLGSINPGCSMFLCMKTSDSWQLIVPPLMCNLQELESA